MHESLPSFTGSHPQWALLSQFHFKALHPSPLSCSLPSNLPKPQHSINHPDPYLLFSTLSMAMNPTAVQQYTKPKLRVGRRKKNQEQMSCRCNIVPNTCYGSPGKITTLIIDHMQCKWNQAHILYMWAGLSIIWWGKWMQALLYNYSPSLVFSERWLFQKWEPDTNFFWVTGPAPSWWLVQSLFPFLTFWYHILPTLPT